MLPMDYAKKTLHKPRVQSCPNGRTSSCISNRLLNTKNSFRRHTCTLRHGTHEVSRCCLTAGRIKSSCSKTCAARRLRSSRLNSVGSKVSPKARHGMAVRKAPAPGSQAALSRAQLPGQDAGKALSVRSVPQERLFAVQPRCVPPTRWHGCCQRRLD